MAYSIDAKQALTSDRPKSLQSLSNVKVQEISFEEHDIYVGAERDRLRRARVAIAKRVKRSPLASPLGRSADRIFLEYFRVQLNRSNWLLP
jgi:hypothetical protein